MSPADRKAMAARVAYIGQVLNLPKEETDSVRTDDDLIAFAQRHHQSLDWICEGDPRVMIARCAG